MGKEQHKIGASYEGINWDAFGISDQEARWVSNVRPGEMNAFLRGELTVRDIKTSIRQDMEYRYLSGYAGLYPYEE